MTQNTKRILWTTSSYAQRAKIDLLKEKNIKTDFFAGLGGIETALEKTDYDLVLVQGPEIKKIFTQLAPAHRKNTPIAMVIVSPLDNAQANAFDYPTLDFSMDLFNFCDEVERLANGQDSHTVQQTPDAPTPPGF